MYKIFFKIEIKILPFEPKKPCKHPLARLFFGVHTAWLCKHRVLG